MNLTQIVSTNKGSSLMDKHPAFEAGDGGSNPPGLAFHICVFRCLFYPDVEYRESECDEGYNSWNVIKAAWWNLPKASNASNEKNHIERCRDD